MRVGCLVGCDALWVWLLVICFSCCIIFVLFVWIVSLGYFTIGWFGLMVWCCCLCWFALFGHVVDCLFEMFWLVFYLGVIRDLYLFWIICVLGCFGYCFDILCSLGDCVVWVSCCCGCLQCVLGCLWFVVWLCSFVTLVICFVW